MSTTYPEYSLTSFPDNIDNFTKVRDISASELSLVNQYQQYLKDGNISAAQAILTANPTLIETQLNAVKINQILDTLMAMEKHYREDIATYLTSIMDSTTEGAIRSDIGILTNLTTSDKSSVVNSINEIDSNTDNLIDDLNSMNATVQNINNSFVDIDNEISGISSNIEIINNDLTAHLQNSNIHKNIIVSNIINNNDGQPNGTILFYTGT